MDAQIWRQVFKADGEPVLSVSLRCPDFSSPSRPIRRIGHYYARLSDAWKARWETTLLSDAADALRKARAESRPFQPWSAALDFTVTREDSELLSLYLDAVVLGPSPHPLVVRSADTWNLKNGMPLALSPFLPSSFRKRKDLLDELKRQAAEQLAGGECLFYQDVQARVDAAFSPQRFFLTQQGPALFYPMLSLGSAVERTPVFYL